MDKTYELRKNNRVQAVREKMLAPNQISTDISKKVTETEDAESLFLDTEFLRGFLNKEPVKCEACEDGKTKKFSVKRIGVCPKCGNKEVLIRHHIKYDPSYQNEETIHICKSCHERIHKRIRRENKCPLSVEEAARLSTKSSVRYKRACGLDPIERIQFSKTMMPNIELVEGVFYNQNSGTVTVTSLFHAYNGGKLYYVDCEEVGGL